MQASSEHGSRGLGPHDESGTGQDADRLRLEHWLPYRLFAISVRVADVLTAYYAPRYGISRAAWRTMAIVANRRGISAKEICQAGSLDQFAVSRAIGQLVEFGYARRNTAKSDKRYAAIELTEEGWAVFKDISALCERIDAELMSQIAPEEAAVLDGILTRLDNASAGILSRGWQGLPPPDQPPPSRKSHEDR
jgi:DNA-binding MarR family transcriptional regulator